MTRGVVDPVPTSSEKPPNPIFRAQEWCHARSCRKLWFSTLSEVKGVTGEVTGYQRWVELVSVHERNAHMLGLGILGWIIIGGLAGWIGSKIMGTDAQQGILLNVVVGIIGGLIGGFLLKLFGVDVEGGGLIFSFLTCLLGAVILLFLVKAVTGRGVRR